MKKWIKKTLYSSVFLLCLCAVACGEGSKIPNTGTSESLPESGTTDSAQQSDDLLPPPTPDENELPIIPVQ